MQLSPSGCFGRCKGTICAANLKNALSDPATQCSGNSTTTWRRGKHVDHPLKDAEGTCCFSHSHLRKKKKKTFCRTGPNRIVRVKCCECFKFDSNWTWLNHDSLLLPTAEASPPQDGSPQVTTEPSSLLTGAWLLKHWNLHKLSQTHVFFPVMYDKGSMLRMLHKYCKP